MEHVVDVLREEGEETNEQGVRQHGDLHAHQALVAAASLRGAHRQLLGRPHGLSAMIVKHTFKAHYDLAHSANGEQVVLLLSEDIMTNIECKVVVITGASSGLGEAAARLLSAEGATVVLGRTRQEL